MKIKQITIIGLGLIGASLAMAIKKKRLPVRIIGTSRRERTIKTALKRRMIDQGVPDPKKAVSGSDLVIIAVPISRMVHTLKMIAPHLKPGAIVTDVGSTKEMIVGAAEKIVPKGRFFVGGHPMAGSEHTGIDSARADLFEGNPYILTPTKKTNAAALLVLGSFLKRLNVRLIKLPPARQDTLVAGISHLPLAVAASLTSAICSFKDKGDFAAVASSGFRDTTRVASGDPILGLDLFATNKKAVLTMIRSFKRSLDELEENIIKGDSTGIFKFLRRAKEFRDGIYGK